MAHDILAKHHANIRRENLFEDAFEQFYPLGEGLKEPIQITFIDKFDTVEAGIDGGGVTKEFLTSVISDAFDPSGALSLFSENDQHLLFPNPTAVEQRRALLRQAGIPERSAEWNQQIRELLKRYEFLGRIIGKCLYEGILVDVNFAGFFLLKWALTGGSSSASKESAYRANLNDLRDLDESLYQGLVSPQQWLILVFNSLLIRICSYNSRTIPEMLRISLSILPLLTPLPSLARPLMAPRERSPSQGSSSQTDLISQ